MKFSDHGLAMIIIGLILTISVYLFFLGIPLILIGAYFLNKKANRDENEVKEKLKDKNKELVDIDNKLKEKETRLANIDVELEERVKEKDKEIDEQLKDKKEDLANIDNTLREIEEEMAKELNIKLKEKENQLANLNNELNQKKKEIILVNDTLEMQEFGLYEPKYDFVTAILYKEKLDEIRQKQKDHIKNKTAAICETEWTVNNNKQQGRAMANANIKQILRTFNSECETTISKVKISNRENSVKRIQKSFETLNKLNERNDVKITPQYLALKLQELDVAIEYELKKQEEKELLREAREKEREERNIQKQLDAEEKRINAQKKKLQDDLNTMGEELKTAADEEKEKLELKIRELELALAKSNDDIEQIADKRTRTGAGYVYILSNIGSFGENVYKIGVTRRDEPQDRVRELSNASVPFKFDTHVFIFSKEAFELEKELHNRFDHKRVNKVNSRKEFFNITYNDVKKIVEENKELVHSFSDKPEAQEYYDTLKIEKVSNKS